MTRVTHTEQQHRARLRGELEAQHAISATETDDGPETLCLLLGASFFGQCRHVRCRATNAAVAAANEGRA